MRITQLETLRLGEFPNILWVRLHTDEGLVGLGETFMGAQAVEAYLHEWAAPRLIGTDPLAIESRHRDLTGYLGWRGSGVETRGNSAVDIALWDLFGKAAGMPLHTALGGKSRDAIRIYNTCAGYQYIRSATNQTSSNWGLASGTAQGPYEDLQGFLHHADEVAQSLLAEGVTAMKIWPFDTACGAQPRPVHQQRRPGHGAGTVPQDPRRGRRPDGHHGGVPQPVAAARWRRRSPAR
jgi:L-alanine-DL-glutamate epimerase-like enolase superfamily enzyme